MQDNVALHASQVAMAAATKCSFEVLYQTESPFFYDFVCSLFPKAILFDFYLPHPLHAPDLAISDFYLFPNLKTNLRGRIFGSGEGVIDAVEEFLGDQEEGLYF